MFEVHYWPTPNGKKVTILLEELGVPYKVTPVNIGRGDQFSDEFLRDEPEPPHAGAGGPRAGGWRRAARPSSSPARS